MGATPEPWAGLLGQRGACQLPSSTIARGSSGPLGSELMSPEPALSPEHAQKTRPAPSTAGLSGQRLSGTHHGLFRSPSALHSPLQLGSAQPAARGQVPKLFGKQVHACKEPDSKQNAHVCLPCVKISTVPVESSAWCKGFAAQQRRKGSACCRSEPAVERMWLVAPGNCALWCPSEVSRG